MTEKEENDLWDWIYDGEKAEQEAYIEESRKPRIYIFEVSKYNAIYSKPSKPITYFVLYDQEYHKKFEKLIGKLYKKLADEVHSIICEGYHEDYYVSCAQRAYGKLSKKMTFYDLLYIIVSICDKVLRVSYLEDHRNRNTHQELIRSLVTAYRKKCWRDLNSRIGEIPSYLDVKRRDEEREKREKVYDQSEDMYQAFKEHITTFFRWGAFPGSNILSDWRRNYVRKYLVEEDGLLANFKEMEEYTWRPSIFKSKEK